MGKMVNLGPNQIVSQFLVCQISKNVAKIANFQPKVYQDATYDQYFNGHIPVILSDFDVRPDQND